MASRRVEIVVESDRRQCFGQLKRWEWDLYVSAQSPPMAAQRGGACEESRLGGQVGEHLHAAEANIDLGCGIG